MSDQIIAKILDYGLAGFVLYYLGTKIDKLTEVVTDLCGKLGPSQK